jgi:hypothetical protein
MLMRTRMPFSARIRFLPSISSTNRGSRPRPHSTRCWPSFAVDSPRISSRRVHPISARRRDHITPSRAKIGVAHRPAPRERPSRVGLDEACSRSACLTSTKRFRFPQDISWMRSRNSTGVSSADLSVNEKWHIVNQPTTTVAYTTTTVMTSPAHALPVAVVASGK